MYFPLILIWDLLVGRRGAIIYLIRDRSVIVEEKEHILFSLVSILIVLFVFPSLERGIKSWVRIILVLVSTLFRVNSPLWVYSLLEISLLPIVIIIIGWSIQPERVSAVYYLFVYTSLFSRPYFIGTLICENKDNFIIRPLLSLFISMAFMVKLPLYFIHIWLPKAHVEAPTAGSILLAGILLKIGGIGFLWLQNYCLRRWNILFLYSSLLGSAISSLICRYQRDLKALVAYRRVAHINYSLIIICLRSISRERRRRILILRHSLISSIIFLVSGVCLHHSNTRIVYLLRRALLLKEITIFLNLSILISNFSAPPLFRLLGEISSFIRAFSSLWVIRLSLLTYFFLVRYYSLLLCISFTGREGKVSFKRRVTLLCAIVTIRLSNFILLRYY